MTKKKRISRLISLLLTGKHAVARKYAGRHVAVVGEKIIPLPPNRSAREIYQNLEKRYSERPVLVYVPKAGLSYILILW